MRREEFLALIDAHSELEVTDMVEGKTPQEEALIICNTLTDRYYRVSVPTLEELHTDELLALFKGEREVVELVTITRIVGYYSQVENWNRSKLGELEGRRRGNYSLDEAVPASAPSAVRVAG